MTTDLIPLENPQPGALFVPGGLEPILARIEDDARSMVPDISTVKGRSAIASLAAKVAKAKTYLDGLGKDYTADLKRQTGAVDAERKAMRDRLDALKAEVRRPLDEWEQAEVDRVDAIKARVQVFTLSAAPHLDSSQIQHCIDTTAAVEVDESFAEFRDEAQAAKEACLYRLTQARDAALHREAEAARLAAEAEAARAKAQQEREERIARESAERATRKAQELAKAEAVRLALARDKAIEDAKREREAAARAQSQAEQRARDAEARAIKEAAFAKVRQERAVREEQERVAAAKRAQEEADAQRAADQAHRERIHVEIARDLRYCAVTDIDDLINAIAAGKIRHLKIIY